MFETNRIAVYKALYRIIGGFIPDVVAACDQVVLRTFVAVSQSIWFGKWGLLECMCSLKLKIENLFQFQTFELLLLVGGFSRVT